MKSQGFTLIELVVVILILGILAAAAITKYVDITASAKVAADRGQLKGLRGATHILYASNILANVTNSLGGYWPTTNDVWANLTQTNAWRTYTNVVYNMAAGVWTAYPAE